MIRILFVVPYKELQEKFERFVSFQDTRDMEIDVCHLYGSRFLHMDMSRYGIIAARGITGRAIRAQFPQATFVEISITGNDIMDALDECVNQYGRRRVALVLADSTDCSVASIRRLTGLDMDVFYIRGSEDVEDALQELLKQGYECVVGGLTVSRRCHQMGIPCVSIRTGEEAIERTVDVVIETAKAINREQVQNHLLHTLLDYHHDAVLACDNRGIIVTANLQAAHLLGAASEPELRGQSIDAVLPDSGWQTVLSKRVATDTMREFDSGMTVMRCAPMILEGQEDGVLFTIQNAERIRDADSKIQKQVRKSGFTAKYTFRDIMVNSDEMKQRLATAYKYALADANVLILGETGTGKEMFAQSIHNASTRSAYPFVPVNCAALPEPLLESELFGYSEGAFSGAQKGGKLGLFELAHKGTIFLDEIGEMPLNLQAKLLRVLEEKNIRRVGDNKIIPVDVRVISATNASIHRKIAEGTFRSDLYYRINLLELRLPPLRERQDDIEPIFRSMLAQFSRDAGRPTPRVTPEAIQIMRQHPWRGNVRELRNFSERLVIIHDGPCVTPAQLTAAGLFELEPDLDQPSAPGSLPKKRRKSKADLAQEMGISRTTLWRRSRKNLGRQEPASGTDK